MVPFRAPIAILQHSEHRYTSGRNMGPASHEPGTMPLGIARRTMGIVLLLVVVVLWTTSNFLGSVGAPWSQDLYKSNGLGYRLTMWNTDHFRRQDLSQAFFRHLHQHIHVYHAALLYSGPPHMGFVAPPEIVSSYFGRQLFETLRFSRSQRGGAKNATGSIRRGELATQTTLKYADFGPKAGIKGNG